MPDNILITGYRREKDNYMKILKLAEKQREMLIEGRMDEVIDILKCKKELLGDIDRIERVIDTEKREYRENCDNCGDTAELIREISNIVEKILSVERENEMIFSTGGRMGGVHSDRGQPVPAQLVAASYGGKVQGGKI